MSIPAGPNETFKLGPHKVVWRVPADVIKTVTKWNSCALVGVAIKLWSEFGEIVVRSLLLRWIV